MPTAAEKRKRSPAAVRIGDYYTDERRLMCVTSVSGEYAYLEDCATGKPLKRTLRVLADWRLVIPDGT